MNRRGFLASAATLPAFMRLLKSPPAFAEESTQRPPYLKLEPFLMPGHDEFPEEAAAMDAEAALRNAIASRALPTETGFRGKSLLASKWNSAGSNVSVAAFDETTQVSDGDFARWVDSLGELREARVFVLPDDTVRYEVASRHHDELLYTVGHWKARWNGNKLSLLAPVEEIRASSREPLFRDVTTAAFSGCSAFQDQLSYGIPFWRAKLDPATGIDLYGSNGIAVGDIDNDGMDEIYVCQPGGLPNRLLKFRGHEMEDITEQWGAGLLDDTSSALFLDLRNSGRQDLVVLRSSGPLLFLNRGTRFQLRDDAFRFATIPGGGFTGMAGADYDRDGKLDLYLCTYVYFQSEAQYTYPVPYHDAENGPPNFLFRNALREDGSGFFEDVTESSGISQNNNRFSFAPAWCDTGGSGWADLYVANDFGKNNFYKNENGRFRDTARQAGVEDLGPGMSASWFDYDGDGRPDLYVANMWSASGQRVVRTRQFAPAQGEEFAEAYRRHTKGNSLYKNRNGNQFEEVTSRESVGMGRWAWSSGGHDLDNDGIPEILVTCGMLTNKSNKDLMSFFWRQVVARSPQRGQPSTPYENGWNAINQFIREDYSWSGREPNVFYIRRGERFYDVSGISGLDFADDSRAFAITDFDNDGRPDIILKSRLGPQVRVLQNNCSAKNNSIALSLRGTKSNRDAIGAKIQINGRAVWLDAGNGYLSQHSKRLTIGLGEAAAAEQVTITWPSGLVQTLPTLQAGFLYIVTEGSADLEKRAFDRTAALASKLVTANNESRLYTTWLLEPIPLPESVAGPGLLMLHNAGIKSPSGVPVKAIDFSTASTASREKWEIVRRYLFDYRAPLAFPFCMLIDAQGRAAKIYKHVPQTAEIKADLDLLERGHSKDAALPFAGVYHKQPRRDYFKFGAALLWAGYDEAALPYLQEVLRYSPANPRVLLLVGRIHFERNQLDEAEPFIRRALEANPSYAEAWSELGGMYQARSNLAEALACYEKAVSLKPDAPYALLNAAQAAEKTGAVDKAEDYYHRAIAADPQNAEGPNGLGLLLAKNGHTEEARKLLQQAIALRRDYGSAINNLGVLYIQTGQLNDAIAAFDYGIRMAPDEDILYLNLARVYAQQGNTEKAREVMRQLLARKPDNETALRGLRELERRQ